jgi:hypothetical protein
MGRPVCNYTYSSTVPYALCQFNLKPEFSSVMKITFGVSAWCGAHSQGTAGFQHLICATRTSLVSHGDDFTRWLRIQFSSWKGRMERSKVPIAG